MEEEASTECVVFAVMQVKSLMHIDFSRSRILPSWGWEGVRIAAWRISSMDLTHFCLIFHYMGSSFVRHCWYVFEISWATPTAKEVMYSLIFLKAWNVSLSFLMRI